MHGSASVASRSSPVLRDIHGKASLAYGEFSLVLEKEAAKRSPLYTDKKQRSSWSELWLFPVSSPFFLSRFLYKSAPQHTHTGNPASFYQKIG